MCWSPGVTLFFVVAEGLAAIVLAARGRPQRRFVRFMLPLILQEVLQLALWAEIESDAECSSPRNVMLTIIEMIVVMLIPTWWAVCAEGSVNVGVAAVEAAITGGDESSLRHADDGAVDEEPWLQAFTARAARERERLRCIMLESGAFAAASVGATVIAVHTGAWVPFCTSRGSRGGHQLWPWVHPPLPLSEYVHALTASAARLVDMLTAGLAFRLASALRVPTADVVAQFAFDMVLWYVYLRGLSGALQIYRAEPSLDAAHTVGWLPQHALVTLGPFFLVPVFLFVGYEVGSFWCFQASAMLLLALLEPAMVRKMHTALRRTPEQARRFKPAAVNTQMRFAHMVRGIAMGPRPLVALLRGTSPAGGGGVEEAAPDGGCAVAFARGPSTRCLWDDELDYAEACRKNGGGYCDAVTAAKRIEEHRMREGVEAADRGCGPATLPTEGLDEWNENGGRMLAALALRFRYL